MHRPQGVSGVGAGVALGPLIGYQLITRSGFTLQVQAGPGYIVSHAEATHPSGAHKSEDDTQWRPFLNLERGWSF